MQILGTPTEREWEGVTHFSHYSTDKFGFYPPQRLAAVIPKLAHISHAELLATSLLQLKPTDRISADDALAHQYFADLPRAVYELQDGEWSSVCRVLITVVFKQLLKSCCPRCSELFYLRAVR